MEDDRDGAAMSDVNQPMQDPMIAGPFGIGSMSSDNDPVFEMLGLCHKCSHRRTPYTCSAFPEGIPAHVLTGDVLHTEPYPGDNGIQFDPK